MRIRIELWSLLAGFIVLCSQNTFSQTWESESATMRINRLWLGVSANGAKASYDYTIGFFPNDYNIVGNRGQSAEAYGGMGLTFTATHWRHAVTDSFSTVAIYGPTNYYMQVGKVISEIQSYVRYPYPVQTVNYVPVTITYQATNDSTQLRGTTADQLIDVTTQHVFNVNVHRRILGWTQSYHDNYAIVDVELTNVGTDTLNNFYVNMNEGNGNLQQSSVKAPYPSGAEIPNLTQTWLHYYGGRVGDTARVFYEYNADNPDKAGDDMGDPSVTQGGRLLYSQITFYTILHASAVP